MWNAVAADAVMLFHFCFIAFALAGSFLMLRWPKAIWLHVPARMRPGPASFAIGLAMR